MNALGPLLFVLLLTALAIAGLTGFGMQDTRDTQYTLVCTPTARLVERRARVPEPVHKRAGLWSRFAPPAFAGRQVTH
jgi:hypothetical protein